MPLLPSSTRRHVQGFTLMELMVVMAIVGLLAGYVGPRLFAQVGRSEVKVAQAQLDALAKALGHYRLDMGRYPATQPGLAALMQPPPGDGRWAGPYLAKALPPDPWGQPYQYRAPGRQGDFELWSWGRDGRPGGQGEDADLHWK